MAAVTKIFVPFAHHYMLIGAGLNVNVADLIQIPGKAETNLIMVFQKWFDADRDVNWDALIKLCEDFPEQLGKAKTNLLAYIGQSVPDKSISSTLLPSPLHDVSNTPVTNITGLSDAPEAALIYFVYGYADIMKQYYKRQTVTTIDWPPEIGKDFFGRLALVEKQDSSTQAESPWHLLRGQVDETVKLTDYKKISVEDILQPTDNSLSLRVVIDGPPGIGKTTLCSKLLNMWSRRKILHQQYNLVLYCPLRNSKIATATTLAGLFVHQLNKYKNVPEWFEKRDGEGLLIIFDGWDELSEQLRQSSLAASIICREKLDQCSVIVTSRSYASFSLLKIMSNLSRHVQVIGFSETEISTVIIQTLQKDTKLAQELIDENRCMYYKFFTTTHSSENSNLAVKLINDLKVRNDVQSLCYIPLVCSMVILVYCKEGGHLPTTLTQLYENFILQTIRRHVKRHDIDPHAGNLSSLPLQLAKPLQEMCQLAYTNLSNTRMTFSSHEVQSLSEAAKEDYLGLMKTFTEYDEEKYQFLHLSIQEFLAAWWIAKYEEKTEEVFKNHFDDDHFRMCLRFVAGLTHLEHESYQQYFNIQQLDLQCKREPLFGFETCHFSYFYWNPDITVNFDHVSSDDFDNVPILLLQLLYESQSTKLCQILAQSINNSHSLCLDRVSLSLSLFDWLCFSYCIKNSNTTWNHLHLGHVSYQSLSVFTAGLTNNSLETQCKRLEVKLPQHNDELLQNILQPSLLCNIQECYCLYNGHFDACYVLLKFLNLPQLKLLHIRVISTSVLIEDPTDKCTELEKCIENNSTLEEMKLDFLDFGRQDEIAIVSVIKGVTRNKTITSLTLNVFFSFSLLDGVIGQLLKDNDTLTALSLDIPNHSQPSSLNIVEVNTPLTALKIGPNSNNKLVTSLLPHVKGLHCLILHCVPYPPHLLFLSPPSLHTLTLTINTAKSAIELFTILQTDTTLKALKLYQSRYQQCG
uniref:NACHT domain-containing protein n=1 Tax=Amphimedon queenslandica TaxID=400682 RepID=A0A1X7TA44_AMPQE